MQCKTGHGGCEESRESLRGNNVTSHKIVVLRCAGKTFLQPHVCVSLHPQSNQYPVCNGLGNIVEPLIKQLIIRIRIDKAYLHQHGGHLGAV